MHIYFIFFLFTTHICTHVISWGSFDFCLAYFEFLNNFLFSTMNKEHQIACVCNRSFSFSFNAPDASVYFTLNRFTFNFLGYVIFSGCTFLNIFALIAAIFKGHIHNKSNSLLITMQSPVELLLESWNHVLKIAMKSRCYKASQIVKIWYDC